MDVSNGCGAEPLSQKAGVEAVTVLGAELGELHAAQLRSDSPLHVAAEAVLGVGSPAPLLAESCPLVEKLTDGGAPALQGRLALTELGQVFGQSHLGLTFGSPTCPGDMDRSTTGVASDEDPEGPDPRLALIHGSPHRGM